jgi:hypothetical protein
MVFHVLKEYFKKMGFLKNLRKMRFSSHHCVQDAGVMAGEMGCVLCFIGVVIFVVSITKMNFFPNSTNFVEKCNIECSTL